MKLKIFLFLFVSFIFNFGLFAQEIVVVPAQGRIKLKDISKKKSVDTLSLPFFYDFSDSSDYSKHFVDNFVSIDYTQSVLPPSIGTACFDALDNKENFYYSYSHSGIADYLTTKPIDLYFPGETSIYISFYYEPQGLLDAPQASDSLVLQFFAPNQKLWKTVWSKSNTGDVAFKQVIIHIADTSFLQKGFRFRFYNRVSMSSSSKPSLVSDCDFWFLDYIYLNKNRSATDTIRKDIAFQNYVKFKFDDYQQIPYTHYKQAENKINHNIYINFRNNDNKLRTIDSMYFVFHDIKHILENDTLQLGSSNFGPFYNFYLKKEDINFRLPNISAGYLDYMLETKLVTDTYDSTCNNIINQHKRIGVVYAYDDGTAENGYGLFGDGTFNSFVAQKYYTYKKDYMTGVAVYFNKTFDNAQPYYFTAIVWNNDKQKGVPAAIIYKEEGFPLNHERLNRFQVYKFAKPVEVSDTFFVGWEKIVDDLMNVGMDLNSTAKNYKYYNINGTWQKSSYPGVLMIRPIFGNVDLADNKELKTNKTELNIYPNPADNFLNIQIDNRNYNYLKIRIMDLDGRCVIRSEFNTNNTTIDVSALNQGIYILEIIEQSKIYRKKFIKK